MSGPGAAPPLALVTGATGSLGPALVDRLRRERVRVRVLTRGRLPQPWPGGTVEAHRGDVADRDAVRAAVDGVQWVFHAAARLHLDAPAARDADEYERVNVAGTRVVAAEAARAGVSRLVFLSTIAVYGPTPTGGVADEETAPAPDTLYAKTKRLAELLLLAPAAPPQPACCVLRLAAVYGPRVKGNYARLARALASGWFLPLGDGRNRRTLVHETDAADAALLAARHPAAPGRIYNVTDGHIHRLGEIEAAICRALGRRPPRLRLPAGPAVAAGRLVDGLLTVLGLPGRLGPLLDRYGEDVAVRGDRIRCELGYQPRHDLESGWRDALCR